MSVKRFLFVGALLLAAAGKLMPQQTSRPHYAPQIEEFYGPLLDTLVHVMGHAPDSISVRFYFGKRGRTIGSVVTVANPRDEDALFHELGHFWSACENMVSWYAADSLRIDLTTTAGVEIIADIYADLLRSRTGRSATDAPAAQLLGRLLMSEAGRPK